MKYICAFFLLSVFLFANQNTIYEYKAINQGVEYKHHDYTAIRSFIKEKQAFYLLVNNTSLETLVVPKEQVQENQTMNFYYKNLLNLTNKENYPLYNDGLKKLDSSKVYLTMDMCPSRKEGYEKDFIQNLITSYKDETPLPMTIFISGKWILKHEQSFLELLRLHQEGILNITWGNHTFYHPYKKELEYEHNFLLIPNVDVQKEVLETEKLLLSYGVAPSVLFRFPGLVSNEHIYKQINALGLIAVGSNAWLDKNELIHQGSIILIHGNKNEPNGIVKAKEQLLNNTHWELGSIVQDLH